MIRVFIVAASPLARAGLENLLAARGAEVAGAAANIDSLADQLSEADADVLLIDSAGEPIESIVDSLEHSGLASDFATILLAEAHSPEASAQALRIGINGVLPGEASPDQLAAALHAAANGLLVLHSALVPSNLRARADSAFSRAGTSSRAVDNFVERPTQRESEVLQMLADGLGNKEIAARLGISDHTVKFHVASILGKLGASSRTEAVSIAIRRGLILL